MKRKAAILMLTAALAASQGITALAANSIGTNVSADANAGSTPTGFVSGSGTISNGGSTITIGDSKFNMIAGKEASLAGLPESAVASINAINAGTNLTEAGTGLDLTGYQALAVTTTMMLFDTNTNSEKRTPSEIPLYVPNLVSGLGNVRVLFFNNFTSKWELLTPTEINVEKKELKVNLPCSGTFSIVYKK